MKQIVAVVASDQGSTIGHGGASLSEYIYACIFIIVAEEIQLAY